jgi:hypothetical protein
VTAHLGPKPSYCTIHLRPLTPSQWMTCWKYGWDEPTSTVAHLGRDLGHNVILVLIVLAVIVVVVLKSASTT